MPHKRKSRIFFCEARKFPRRGEPQKMTAVQAGNRRVQILRVYMLSFFGYDLRNIVYTKLANGFSE
jgi:hypothetical protein